MLGHSTKGSGTNQPYRLYMVRILSGHTSSFIKIGMNWLLCLSTECGGHFLRLQRYNIKMVGAEVRMETG